MPRKSPGAKAKGLGAKLRELRKSSKMTLEDAARAIGLSKQVVSRLENGQRNITPDEVASLLGLYRVTGAKCEQLLRMARTLGDPGWWAQEGPGFTEESATLADYEDRASRITDWAPLLVPGLLQTMEYSRAFMLADGIEKAVIEHRLTNRLRRQHRLTRPDVEYRAFIGEPALRSLASGGDIEHVQLRELEAAAQCPNITVRVVRAEKIPPTARLGGFLALEFPSNGNEPVVHVELARSGVFLDEEPLTAPYFRSLDQIADVAMSATESTRWVSQVERDTES